MNITFKRWLTIIVYGCLSAFFLKAFVQVEWVQKIVIWCGDAFTLFGVYPQKVFLIILGFLLYQFLLKMNIYSKKSSIRTWIVYPPITFIILPFIVVTLILFFDEFQFNNTSWNHAFNLMSLIAFITGISICDFYFLYRKQDINEDDGVGNQQNLEDLITSKSTYKDYKKWFENDEPISEKHQLSLDLIHYVERISLRINKENKEKKSVHISLVGNFGTGKSSIIKCVEKELNPEFICCNIDTWAATPKSINAFVLTKVIESVSDYADMGGLKSLPSEYIEALKLGNNTSKLLAVFSGITTDPLQGLTKLNSVLGTINKKLLIVIQDVDRSADPKKTINELASLLDKLKGQSNINFIIALGYDSKISETISKVCDYREDLIKMDFKEEFECFIDILNKRAIKKNFLIPNKPKHSNVLLRGFNPYGIIRSQRSFKHICRRIASIWKPDKLMGEIDLESTCLMIILREEYPLIFDYIIKNSNSLINAIDDLESGIVKSTEKGPELDKARIGEKAIKARIIALNECADFYPSMGIDKLTNYLKYLLERHSNSYQALFYQHPKPQYHNYLNRILLESVPNTELKDQDALELFKNIDETGSVEILIGNLQSNYKGNNWIEAYLRFSHNYFRPTNKNVYEAVYIAMVDFYYEDLIRNNRSPSTLINHHDIQKFLILLLEKCLTTENVNNLFELTLKIPTILMANTYAGNPDFCLGLFLSKGQDGELYKIFINKLSVNNEMSKQLYIVDSNKQSLDWIVNEFIQRRKDAYEISKEIILLLLEKNNKENKYYEFDLWFVCHLLDWLYSFDKDNSFDENSFLGKMKFSAIEIELLKSCLNQLNVDGAGEHYFQLSDPKVKCQRILSALEKHA